MLVKRLVACEHCGHGFDAVDTDSIVCEKKERIFEQASTTVLDARRAVFSCLPNRCSPTTCSRSARPPAPWRRRCQFCYLPKEQCSHHLRFEAMRHEPLKSSFVSVVLLLSATASAWAPSSPRRFTVQGQRSVLRRGRRTAARALAAQVDTRQRRVAPQRLRQRSDADQANVVACTGNSIATNEHARAAPRRTDQRDARHRLVALQPVGQRHTWPSSPS